MEEGEEGKRRGEEKRRVAYLGSEKEIEDLQTMMEQGKKPGEVRGEERGG